MNDVYWFLGKAIRSNNFSQEQLETDLPIPLVSIAEIHFTSQIEHKRDVFSNGNIKLWVSPDSTFDINMLLINRLAGSNLESMLIVEEIDQQIFYGLFGKAALVGRYNLPPEFEINNSGWASPAIISEWLKKSEPKPNLISVGAETNAVSNPQDDLKAGSMLEAFILAKQIKSIPTFLTLNSAVKNSISYLSLERI